MSMSRIDTAALFSDEVDAFPEEPDTMVGRRHLATRQRAEEMAAWCLVTRQTCETYLSLTRDERDAFLEVATRH